MRQDSWLGFKPDSNRRHEVYEGKSLLIPELTILGWLHFKKALPGALHPDTHEHVEVLYMVEGRVNWWIDGRRLVLKGGQIIVIPPDRLHGSEGSILQPCQHYWLRFNYPASAFTGVTVRDTNNLVRGIKQIAGSWWTVGEEGENIFRQMIECHRAPGSFSALRAQALFQLLLVLLAKRATSLEIKRTGILPQPHFQARIDMAMALLKRENIDKAPTVVQMAEMAGLKEATFRRVFEHHVGTKPSHFITTHRISRAKHYLFMGKSVTEIAHKLGFSSSQYFATVFKQWTGLQPSEFVKAKKRSKDVLS